MVEETTSTRRNRERSQVIITDSVTRRHLKFFIDKEFNHQNQMISISTMRLRAFPEEILGLKDGFERFWNSLAFNGHSVRDLAKIPVSKWNKDLRNSVPSSAVVDDKLSLSERKMMLFDIASLNGGIHPSMRRAMASEILKTLIPQAEQILSSQKSATGQMRTPVQMLQAYQYPEKRHLQLTRDLVGMHYDSASGITEIKIPYTDKPLIAKDVNLTNEKYDLMIIRQTPNIEVSDATPWQVDLMHTTHRYLLELTDQRLDQRRKRAA
jgi:hypothetical protein